MRSHVVKQKHPFLLLEVIISFALVVLCVTPLMQSPINAYRALLAQLEKLECDRIAAYTFSEIKLLLLENEIPWTHMPDKISQAPHRLLQPPSHLQIPGLYSKQVFRSYQIWVEKEKEGSQREIYRILGLRITLIPKSQTAHSKPLKYNYLLFCQKPAYHQPRAEPLLLN